MIATLEDHAEAANAATEAGSLLVALRGRLQAGGAAAGALGREGDRQANDLLVRRLSTRYPDDAILTEEAPDDRQRLSCRRVWIIDPLDGTREFGELGRQDWAVHVALVIDGVSAAGAVALPARGITLSTSSPPVLARCQTDKVRLLVSRSRPPAFVDALADRLGAAVVPMGSAGAKAMAVVLGEGEIFVHAGGQYEWDTAAPVAVAVAAGLHASRIDGSALRYNNANAWLPDVLVCTRDLAARALKALSVLAEQQPTTGPRNGQS